MGRKGKSRAKSLYIINNLYRMLMAYPNPDVNVGISKKHGKPYVEVRVWYTVGGFNVDRRYYISEKYIGILKKKLSDAFLKQSFRIENRMGYEYDEQWVGVRDRIDRVLKVWNKKKR